MTFNTPSEHFYILIDLYYNRQKNQKNRSLVGFYLLGNGSLLRVGYLPSNSFDDDCRS